MTMIAARAMALRINVTRKLVARVASRISRSATSAVGRSVRRIVVSLSTGRPTVVRKTSARLRRSKAKWLTGPARRAASSARWARSAGAPLPARRARRTRAAVDADHVDVAVELGCPLALGIGRDVDLQDRIAAGGQLVDRALGDDPAAVDDDGPFAQVLDEIELVRREEHRRAPPGLADEDLGEGVDGHRVEAGERLVEHEDVGLVDQRADQLDALLVAEREVLQLVAGAVGQTDSSPSQRVASAAATSRGSPRSCPR